MAVKTQPETEYCWVILHPTLGVLGGTPDDPTWSSDREAVEKMSTLRDDVTHKYLCEWPTQVICRQKPSNNRAEPGSVKPSRRVSGKESRG